MSAVRLKYWNFSSYCLAFVNSAQLNSNVHSSVGVHDHIDSRSHGSLESLFLSGDFVLTRREIGELIIPAIVRWGTAADTRLQFRGGHPRSPPDSSWCICHLCRPASGDPP